MTDTTTAPGNNAVAVRTPAKMIDQYSGDFRQVLPSHIKPQTWLRVAQGALKRGRRLPDGRTELEAAAANNPAKFMSALLDAARQGLEPGTEQYYLTVRKEKGRPEILGITGYQGHIELIYRAGAVSTVVADVVRANDTYRYRRGLDERPVHEYESFTGETVRGPLRGVYAYAVMKDGSTSRVIELGVEDINRIKKSSTGSDSEHSPWQKHTEAMWLKSAVRQLQKWVPTSPEYLEHQARAAGVALGAAETERDRQPQPTPPLQAEVELGATSRPDDEWDDVPDDVDATTGEVIDADVVPDDTPASPPPDPGPAQATKDQARRIGAAFVAAGVSDHTERAAEVSAIVARDITSVAELTEGEAELVIATLTARSSGQS